MNKKKDPDLVRNTQYTVWLNRHEHNLFLAQLRKANGMSSTDFMRAMLCNGYVQAPIKRSERIDARDLLRLLIEYKTNFNRISNLIKGHNPELHASIEDTVRRIQHVINLYDR